MNIRKNLFSSILLFTLFFIFLSANFELYFNYKNTPEGTTYFGATGFFFDYYQFLSWIRDGAQGKILVSARYIPSQEPPVLIHTFFSTLGYVSSFLHFKPYIVYHLARNIFLAVWLFTVWLLVKTVIVEGKEQYLALFLIFVSSGFPFINIFISGQRLLPLISFWKTFYTLEKFTIPPHHLAANSFFLLVIFLILKHLKVKRTNGKQYLIISIAALGLALSNPGAMSFLLGILGIMTILALVKKGEKDKRFIKIFAVILVSTLPFFLYYWQIFNRAVPWKYYYYGEKVGRYNVSSRQYLGSLGPLLFTAFLSFCFWKKFQYGEKILALWIVLPILMFPFVGRSLPFAMSRLFSLNIFIPCSLLSVYFFKQFKPRFLVGVFLRYAIVAFLALSLSLGLAFSIKDVYEPKFINYYNVFLPNDLLKALKYLRQNSRPFSVVIAGENISNLIPAFTDNYVVLGRQDAYANYERVKKEVDKIYLRQKTNEEIANQLRNWNVQYLIFGLDQIGYEEFLKKGKVDFINKVFSAGDIVIGEVNPPRRWNRGSTA